MSSSATIKYNGFSGEACGVVDQNSCNYICVSSGYEVSGNLASGIFQAKSLYAGSACNCVIIGGEMTSPTSATLAGFGTMESSGSSVVAKLSALDGADCKFSFEVTKGSFLGINSGNDSGSSILQAPLMLLLLVIAMMLRR